MQMRRFRVHDVNTEKKYENIFIYIKYKISSMYEHANMREARVKMRQKRIKIVISLDLHNHNEISDRRVNTTSVLCSL